MYGRFACLIVIASIFCTGFVGYLANADVEQDERQVYDYSANLVPSVISSDVQQYTPYNPTENVTGWESDITSNAKVPTTNKVSPYILQKRVLSYETSYLSFARAYHSGQSPEWHTWSSTGDAYISVVAEYAERPGTTVTEYAYAYFDAHRSEREIDVHIVGWIHDEEDYGDDLENAFYIGGYHSLYQPSASSSKHELSIVVKDTNGNVLESATNDTPLYVVNGNALKRYYSQMETGDVIELSNYEDIGDDVIVVHHPRVYSTLSAEDCGWDNTIAYRGQAGGGAWDYYATYGAYNATLFYGGTEDDTGLMFDKDSETWALCKKNALGQWYQTSKTRFTADQLVFVSNDSGVGDTDYGGWVNFIWDKITIRPATYADNNRFTDIGTVTDSQYVTNDTAIWSNDNSNGAITFLAKLNDSTGNLHIVTKTRVGSGDTATYAVNGDWMAYTNSTTNSTPGPVTPTGYVLITLDYINGVCTYSPVTSIESSTITEGGVQVVVHNPQTYQVGGYSVRLPSVNEYPYSDINRLELTYMGGTGEAYIVDTVVQLDPEGKLWSDPVIYLGAYFPEAFDPDKAPRVWFNAFVALGNTVRINGVDYAVSEGQITVDDTRVELKGMAIDWEKAGDGLVHVYIAPGGDYDKRIDVGVVSNTPVDVNLMVGGVSTLISTTEGYVVSMDGVWYFEVGLYDGSTETYNRLDLNITKGWGLSFSGACLLFCGCIILFTAIGTYYFKESENQPDFTDWLIIVMAIVLTIVIAGLLG